jgi:hypothetical protein
MLATPREKFQQLLKKLFQFDSAELDFGMFLLMLGIGRLKSEV